MTPRVSVCVPTFNGAAFLAACLESALAQTCRELEVIVADDQSADDTVNIAEAFARRDGRLRVHRNPRNLGLVGAWNHCAGLARTEWVKFVFQDDVIAPDCVERLLAVGDAGSPLVVCRRDFIFEPGVADELVQDYQRRPSMDALFDSRERIAPQEFARAALLHPAVNFVGEPTAVLLRRELFERFGGFNADLAAICDFEFWARVGVHTGLAYVPETLATFRVHRASATGANLARAQYRVRRLDRLVLFHEFALAAVYEPLRVCAAEMSPPVDLELMLAREARKARRRAGRSGGARDDSGATNLELWRDIARRYPGVRRFSRPTALLGRRLGAAARRVLRLPPWRRERWS